MYEIQSKIETHILSLPDYSGNSDLLRFSKLGECPRLLDYEMQRGRSPFSFEQAMRMHAGTYLGHMWRDIMTGALGADFVGAEEELTVTLEVDGETHVMPGHPDGEIISLDAIWELKSVSDSTYKMVEGQGHALPQHYLQGNGYAYVKKRSNILFQYFNTDNKQSLFLMAPMVESLAESSFEMMRQRIRNKKAGVIADRPHTDPTKSPCWFCPRIEECYAGYASEVSAMTPANLNEEQERELQAFTEAAWSARMTRLECEKHETKYKEAISKMLLKLGFNNAKVGTFTVNVKLGKNNNPLVEIKQAKEKKA